MKFLNKVLNRKVGASPGEIMYVGDLDPIDTRASFIKYNKDSFEAVEINSLNNVEEMVSAEGVNWIHITGLGDDGFVRSVSSKFGIHNLSLEDAFNTHHMAKYEELEDYLMFVGKGYIENEEDHFTHLAVFLKGNLLITLQDTDLELVYAKIERIKQGKGKARRKNADYLFFIIIDTYIDTLFTFCEKTRSELLDLEEKMIYIRSNNYIENILQINKKLSQFRKIIYPLHDAVKALVDSDTDLIESVNQKYLVDLKDHVNELIEHYNTFNDFTRNLISLNDNNLNTDTNRVMKVLTLIATIFIPLTFIAGIYGMNFKYMPELDWEFGYPIIMSFMGLIGAGLFIYMKKKNWL